MQRTPIAPVSRSVFRKTGIASAVSTAAIVSVMAVPSKAQMLEEVMVTATKRTESVQDVPLAITAMTGDFVTETNLNDVKDLVSFTPGVTGNSQDSFIDAISVRGVRTQDFGVGGDPSSAFFKNDLYEGRNGSAVTSLYDMDRVEVLRGPQGFLFGRSAIGGAFSVHTQRALIDSNEGYIDVDLAERNHIVTEGAINVPVNDRFAMRFAGYTSNEDGFADNVFSGDELIEHDKWALRWSTATEAGNASIYTTAEYEKRNQSGSVYRAVNRGDIWDTLETALGPIALRGGDEDIDVDEGAGSNDDAEILTLGVRVDYEFDFATLTSNTGFKSHDYFYEEDYDGTPLLINNYRQDQDGDYFQQELRLTSNSEGALSWYAGVSYYKEDIDAEFTFVSGEDTMCQYYGYYYNSGMTFSGCADLYAYYGSPFTPSASGELVESGRVIGDYSGWGAYVNLDIALSDTVDLSLGVRYTDDEKDFKINVPTPASDLGAYWAYGFTTTDFIEDSESWSDVTPRVMLRWHPGEDSMFFASYTEGFKAGGFGTFNLNDPTGNSAVGNTDIAPGTGFRGNRFNEEYIDSYEFGYKDTLFDGNTNVDLTAFYYEYKDLQVVVADAGGAALVGNAGNVDAWGLEGSLTSAIGENWTLYLAMGYLDSEATNLQEICSAADVNACEGSSLFWAPEFSGAFVLTGEFPMAEGAVEASLEAFWESERGGGFEKLESTKIDSYAEMALRVGYHSDNNWHVDAYVENLTDEFTWDGQNNNGGLIPSHFFGPKRPRTFGVRFGYFWE